MTTMRHEAYWRATARLTTVIVLVCVVVTFVIGFLGRDLGFRLFGSPFSFYFGIQGVPVVYGLLIWWYTRRMDRLDRETGVDRGDGDERPVAGALR